MGISGNFMLDKTNILKRLLGRRMVVIKDHIKNIYYYATIHSVIDAYNVEILNSEGEKEKVSIFDLRSPSQEYQ